MQKRDELASWRAEIFKGRQHKLVFLSLEDIAKSITEITNKVNNTILKEEKSLTLREVSRALKWLSKNDFAYSPNFQSKHGVKGIIYRLTPKGKKIIEWIEKNN